jgi:quercetin dioxygenase-like cupin family protein
LKRTLLRQTDGPADGYVTVETKVEIEPAAPIARHTHPGIESGYVIEGGTELTIDGVGALTLKPGDAYQVPTGVPHSGTSGPAWTVIAATCVVRRANRSPRRPPPEAGVVEPPCGARCAAERVSVQEGVFFARTRLRVWTSTRGPSTSRTTAPQSVRTSCWVSSMR